jgi:hypothetical protein
LSRRCVRPPTEALPPYKLTQLSQQLQILESKADLCVTMSDQPWVPLAQLERLKERGVGE